jgi:hypothetical protein
MSVSNTKEYRAWIEMRRRCYDPKRPSYRLYGGRGVIVCDRWRYDFAAFLEDVGYAPSSAHSLDRINTEGGYEPGNVRWATAQEQSNNWRHNVFATVDGEAKTVADWARETGLHPATIGYRLRNGYDDTTAVSKPSKGWRRTIPFNGEARTAKEWSTLLGVPVSTINYRHRNGLPIAQTQETSDEVK